MAPSLATALHGVNDLNTKQPAKLPGSITQLQGALS